MGESKIKDRREVRFWKYDDGSYGLIVVERTRQDQSSLMMKKRYVDCRVCKTKTKLKDEIEKIQKQCTADGYVFQKKKIKIKNGLQYISKKDFSEKNQDKGKCGWGELEKFLNSCGTDIENKREVLRLFSGILSGYYAQVLVPMFYKIYLIALQNRAPVLVLNPSDKRFNVTFDFISKTIKALTVPTHTKDKLRSKCPPFLPQGIGQKSLDQGSFLWYKKKKNRFPSQYRDTAVLVFGSFFSVNKIRRFIERNRWATVVIFNAPAKVNKVPAIRLSDSLLVCLDFDWNGEDIKYLIERFALSLSRLTKKKKFVKKLTNKLREVGDCILRYHAQKGIQRFQPTEEHFIALQMLTLQLFLESCQDEKIIDTTQRKQVQSEWFNLLLPGCSQFIKPDEETISHELEAEEDKTKQTIQSALTKMLTADQLIHFPYTKKNGPYEEANPEDPSVKYWGYLRWYKPKKNEKTPFRALVFKESKFKEIVPRFLKEPCNVDNFVKDLRSCNLEYLFSTSKARLGGKTAENALIFIIDKMEFLSEETRAMVAGKIPDQE